MKQKVSYSSVISGLTIAFIVAFVAIFVLFWVFIDKPFDNVFFWILVGLFCLCFFWIFGSMPDSVSYDDDYVGVHRPFHTRRYRISDIKSIERADENTYRDADKGLHFHGKYKYPVLVTLKNGQKFVIGSDDSGQLVDYVNDRIS